MESRHIESLLDEILMQVFFLLDRQSKLRVREVNKNFTRLISYKGSWEENFVKNEIVSFTGLGLALKNQNSNLQLSDQEYRELICSAQEIKKLSIYDDELNQELETLVEKKRKDVSFNTFSSAQMIGLFFFSMGITTLGGLIISSSTKAASSPEDVANFSGCSEMQWISRCEEEIQTYLSTLFAFFFCLGGFLGYSLKMIETFFDKKIDGIVKDSLLPTLNTEINTFSNKTSILFWKMIEHRDYIVLGLGTLLAIPLIVTNPVHLDMQKFVLNGEINKEMIVNDLLDITHTVQGLGTADGFLLAYASLGLLQLLYAIPQKLYSNCNSFFHKPPEMIVDEESQLIVPYKVAAP